MPRKSKDQIDREAMRDLWDELRELNVDYGAVVNLTFYPSKRAGIFVFRMTAVPIDPFEFEIVGTQAIQFEFPSPLMQSLSGALWSYSMKLTQQYEEAYKRSAPRRARGPSSPL